MENEVARAITGRHGYIRYRIELAGLPVQTPNVNGVGSEIATKNKVARRIGFDHVSVGAVVTADGEASGWRAFRMYGTRGLRILFDVGSGCKAAVGQDRQYREASAVVVRYQNIFS